MRNILPIALVTTENQIGRNEKPSQKLLGRVFRGDTFFPLSGKFSLFGEEIPFYSFSFYHLKRCHNSVAL